MDTPVNVDWSNTRVAFQRFLKLCNCVYCNNILNEPCSFHGKCNHNYCRSCAITLVNHSLPCPSCNESLLLEDLQSNFRFNEVIPICLKLKKLIGLEKEDGLTHVENDLKHIEDDHADIEDDCAHVEDNSTHVEDDLKHIEDDHADIEDDCAHVEDDSTHVEDDLKHIEDNSTHVEDDFTHVEDYRTNKGDDSTHVEDDLTHLEDDLTHLEDDSTHVEDDHAHIEADLTNIEDGRTHLEDDHKHVEDDRTHLEDDLPHLEDDCTYVEDDCPHVEDDLTHIEDNHAHIEDDLTHIEDDCTYVEDDCPHVEDDRTHLEDSRTHVEDESISLKGVVHTDLEVLHVKSESIQPSYTETEQIVGASTYVFDDSHFNKALVNNVPNNNNILLKDKLPEIMVLDDSSAVDHENIVNDDFRSGAMHIQQKQIPVQNNCTDETVEVFNDDKKYGKTVTIKNKKKIGEMFKKSKKQTEERQEKEKVPETTIQNDLKLDLMTNNKTHETCSQSVDFNLQITPEKVESILLKENAEDFVNKPLNFKHKQYQKLAHQNKSEEVLSQFSNVLTDIEISNGVQKNPEGLQKKPKVTYIKSKQTEKREKRKKLFNPQKQNNFLLDASEDSVFEFNADSAISSNQTLKHSKTVANAKRANEKHDTNEKEDLNNKNDINEKEDFGTEEEINEPQLNNNNQNKRKRKSKRMPTNQNKNKINKESQNRCEIQETSTTTKIIEKKTQTAAKKPPKNINKRNMRGETGLHTACIKGNINRVKELLAFGAETNTKDYNGWTPLHEASSHGFYDIVVMLIDHGAIIECVGGDDNDSPLHDAVSNGRLDVVKCLLERGAPTHIRNANGFTPVELAITADMKMLFKEAAMMNIETPEDTTRLELSFTATTREKIFITTNLTDAEKRLVTKHCKIMECKLLKEFDISGLSNSAAKSSWLREADYEVQGVQGDNASRRARMNSFKSLPALFDGCSFHLTGSFTPSMPKQTLTRLIKLGGGKILLREPKSNITDPRLTPISPAMDKLKLLGKKDGSALRIYHTKDNSPQACCAEYIIYDPITNKLVKNISSPILCSAPTTWLLDCVSSFSIVDIREEHAKKKGLQTSQE